MLRNEQGPCRAIVPEAGPNGGHCGYSRAMHTEQPLWLDHTYLPPRTIREWMQRMCDGPCRAVAPDYENDAGRLCYGSRSDDLHDVGSTRFDHAYLPPRTIREWIPRAIDGPWPGWVILLGMLVTVVASVFVMSR